MKNKALLIYNPVAGDRSFPDFLDTLLQKTANEFFISILRTTEEKNFYRKNLHFFKKSKFDYIFIAGGDGTINQLINFLMVENIDIPLAIIPAGTANDFATYLNMPSDFADCIEVIKKRNIKAVDIGRVNDKFFVNVCIGGLLSEIPHETDNSLKNKMGKLAYYLNGIKGLSSSKPISVKVTTSNGSFQEDIYLFLVLNSSRGGGFNNLSDKAKIDDGLFELILLKAKPIYKMINLVVELFQNKHFKNDNLIYKQDHYFKIELIETQTERKLTDIDGEKGPAFPLEIKVLEKALKVFRN